jgi:hypothetical protein
MAKPNKAWYRESKETWYATVRLQGRDVLDYLPAALKALRNGLQAPQLLKAG